MSIETLSRVWRISEQKGTALLLLLALADFADDNGFSWPAVDTLAKKVRMGERYTQALLRKLEASGELAILQRRGRSSLYIVRTGGTEAMLAAALARAEVFDAPRYSKRKRDQGVNPSAPVNYSAPRGEPQCTPGVNPSAPDPSLPVSKQQGNVVVVLTDLQNSALDALVKFGWSGQKTARRYVDKHDPDQILGLVLYAREHSLTVAWVRSSLDANEWAPEVRDDRPVWPEVTEPAIPRQSEAEHLGVDPEALKVWRKVLELLAQQMTKETFESLLLGSIPFQWSDGRAVIGVRSPSAVPWLDARLRPVIERAAARVTGRPVGLTFTAQSADREDGAP